MPNSFLLDQIYGDCLVYSPFRTITSAEFAFHSISTNKTVTRLNFQCTKYGYHKPSTYRPVIYVCCEDSTTQQYHIYQIDAINQTSKLIFSNKLKTRASDDGIRPIELMEDANGRFLRICQFARLAFVIEILDLQKREIVGCFDYIAFNRQKKLSFVSDHQKSHHTEQWSEMTFYPGSKFCSLVNGKYHFLIW